MLYYKNIFRGFSLGKLLVLIILFLFVFSSIASSSSCCEQYFKIYGKTKGETSILMWAQHVSGGCVTWYVNHLLLGFDKPYNLEKNTGYNEIDWNPPFIEDLPMEEKIVLSDSLGRYKIVDSVYLSPPVFDSTVDAIFAVLINTTSGNATDWKRNCDRNCADHPIFEGVEAELIYMFEPALYKNYTFSEVVYFPEFKYLVLVTNQSRLASGMDTMHGMLVYKLNTEEE